MANFQKSINNLALISGLIIHDTLSLIGPESSSSVCAETDQYHFVLKKIK